MSHVLLDKDGSVKKYPYSIEQLRADNPDTSFSANPPISTLGEWGVFPVAPTSMPAPTPTENFVQGPPEYRGGQWVQTWVSQPASAEETAQRNEELAQKNELAQAKLDPWMVQFLAMTPAQAQTFVMNNSANLDALKVHVGRLAYAVRFGIRREFNR